MNTTIQKQRFNGSILLSLDVAHAAVHRIIRQEADAMKLNLTPMELYILAALLEKDGVLASRLAAKVGRAATSFTPSLDKLQTLGFVFRKPDPTDRRAINIHLTDLAKGCGDLILEVLAKADERIKEVTGLTAAEWDTFNKVAAALQAIQ